MKIKPLFLLLLGAILFATTYLSCTKHAGVSGAANTIVGKWKVLYDSSCAEGPAVGGTSCHVFKSSVSDSADAYYNFTSDGKIYIDEGGTIDTATYLLSSDSLTVINSDPQSPVIFYVTSFANSNSLILTSVGYDPIPYGIWFLNHVSLSRD